MTILLGWKIEVFLISNLSSGQMFLKVKVTQAKMETEAARSTRPPG